MNHFTRAYLCKFAACHLEAVLSRMASTNLGMVYSLALTPTWSPISSAVCSGNRADTGELDGGH